MAACPDTPNCVSSLSLDPGAAIEPLALRGDPRQAWIRLHQVVEAIPRTRIRVDEPGYLAVECRSQLFGFVDDLEFQLDRGTGVIHLRSVARVGYSDLGVNRRRAEEVRRMFNSGEP